MSNLAIDIESIDKNKFYLARLSSFPQIMQPIQFTYNNLFQCVGSSTLRALSEIIELGAAIGPNKNAYSISAVVDSISYKCMRAKRGYTASIIMCVRYEMTDSLSNVVTIVDIAPSLLKAVCEREPCEKATKELTNAIKRAIIDDMMQRSLNVARSDEQRITDIRLNIPMLRFFLLRNS